MFVYIRRVENPKIKIALFTNFMLCLLIILSFINAIFLETDNRVLIVFIEALNLTCSVMAAVILIMFCIICIRLINLVEDLLKRKFISAVVFVFCLVQIFLFSFFAYTLFLRGYESRSFMVSALLIFSTFACRIITVGSIFMLIAISANMCYIGYKCSRELVERAANPC
jgi:hypothetical protein